MLTYEEFCLLRDLAEKKQTVTNELFNSRLGQALHAKGFIDLGSITTVGLEALEPFKVDNAVIMAAGFSSRFAPLSYETPKGLTSVRGEKLIERQIRQLKAAGIEEIIVVVGYKKALFEYLEERFGVTIVVNHEFSKRNNHSSLWAVRDHLKNSYICSVDNYFVENPFHSYEMGAFYSAEFSAGETSEWCMEVDQNNQISSVRVGGKDAWYMIGHAYFDQQFSDAFIRILSQVYDRDETKDQLWEAIFVAHLDSLSMKIHKNTIPNIYEFDSIEDAKRFDPTFFEHNPSRILDDIEKVLNVKREQLTHIYPLKSGLTNLSCYFSVDGRGYVYRYPGVGTEKLVDRQAEFDALKVAQQTELDGTYIAGCPDLGWKISRFVDDARMLNPKDDSELKAAMMLMRKLHQLDATIERDFDFLKQGLKYEGLWLPYVAMTDDDRFLREAVLRLTEKTPTRKMVLTHNDFFGLNILIDQANQLHLIDWEYAGMGDEANDYGTFVVTSLLTDEEADKALDYYLERMPTLEERRHFYAYVVFAAWCWYNWALYKEALDECVGDWRGVYRRYAVHYLTRLNSLAL